MVKRVVNTSEIPDYKINPYDEQYNFEELGLYDSGVVDRYCPHCGSVLYNNVDTTMPEYDICGICGWERRFD